MKQVVSRHTGLAMDAEQAVAKEIGSRVIVVECLSGRHDGQRGRIAPSQCGFLGHSVDLDNGDRCNTALVQTLAEAASTHG